MQHLYSPEDRLCVYSGEGVWHGEDDSRFAFTLDLEVRDHRCEGIIKWRASSSEFGTEHVRGTLDPKTGEVRLYGYRIDNPVLLSLDEYLLRWDPNAGSFEGTSRGPWGHLAQCPGRPVGCVTHAHARGVAAKRSCR